MNGNGWIRMKMLRMAMLATVMGGAMAVAAGPVLADKKDDHERARQALERGEIMALSRILDIAEADGAGRVIEVELDRDDGRWIYELELLTPDGRLLELEIDAANGDILERDYDDRDE